VRAEQRLALLLEVGLIGIEHAVQPREQLLGAVVGVEDNGDAVGWGESADILGTGDGTSDGSGLVLVVNALAGEVGSTTLRELEDDGRLGVTGSLESSDDGRGRGNVDGGDGEALLLGVLEEVQHIVTDDDTGLARQVISGTHFGSFER
jgi:hypothetical protein